MLWDIADLLFNTKVVWLERLIYYGHDMTADILKHLKQFKVLFLQIICGTEAYCCHNFFFITLCCKKYNIVLVVGQKLKKYKEDLFSPGFEIKVNMTD